MPNVRAAVVEDADAMGRVMVTSWLSAHRGQMPDAAYQKRVEEWTPEVSAAGWARTLAERGHGNAVHDVVLVGEDDAGDLIAMVSATAADDDTSGAIAEIGTLYVLPDHHRHGVGRLLLGAAAREMAARGFSALQLAVLTANLPARAFYEAMGGREVGQRVFDEEGYLLPQTVYAWPDITALDERQGGQGDGRS